MSIQLKTYIESGIIEDYLMGTASQEERLELERMMAIHPSLKAELEANQFALLEYILQYEQAPPVQLKDKIWEKLANLGEMKDDTAKSGNVISMNLYKYKNRFRLSSVAMWLFLMTSMTLNVWLFAQWKNVGQIAQNQEIIKSQSEHETILWKTNYQKMKNEMDTIHQSSTKIVMLGGTETEPKAKVWLYWNEKTQAVLIKVENLPAPPEGKQYQLWSIEGEIVKDAGMINHLHNICTMKSIPRANAFAITLEKQGGVPKAEGKMYAICKL